MTVESDSAPGPALPHDSAQKHVAGHAVYADDIPEPRNLLHVYIAMSEHARAQLTDVDLGAVRAAPGVAWVGCADNVPGVNDTGPVVQDEQMFAASELNGGAVHHVGQAMFAVAADSLAMARAAAALANINYAPEDPILTVDDAMAAGSFVSPPYRMARGDVGGALDAAPHRLAGRIEIGGQEQFYLEGQIAIAWPGEDDDVRVVSSNQHPSECQIIVARVLGIPAHAVTVEVQRLGGGFGGKETQGNLMAACAALAAKATGRPAKCRLDRDQDMILTGKRHDFVIDYHVGFDDTGLIKGVRFMQMARCGWSLDLSAAICDRAMFHADNCYFLPAAEVISHRCRTNTVSNTAFRGFGGPQGMLGIERVIEHIAHALEIDPLDVRRTNYYDAPDGSGARATTPFHMTVEDCVIGEITEDLVAASDYPVRRAAITQWNVENEWIKRGLALTPVKFGISFTTTHLNQAGALVHIYQDGSIQLNHGGVEMGQGLHTKIAQIAAEELSVCLERVRITATRTDKVPNTSATAASSGSDLNGMAVRAACAELRGRLLRHICETQNVTEAEVTFLTDRVEIGRREMSFEDLAKSAYLSRVPLSATGFYATPKIHWDKDAARGRPFYYFAYGAAVTEVAVDTLTGESRMTRVDIIHDVGRSLNPAVDLGQIEGGFIQGAGWVLMEELCWDEAGRLKTHAPSTYKIPTASDRPAEMNIKLWDKGMNRELTIKRSKAVGEPPLMLAISAHQAIGHAISSTGTGFPALDTPATPEEVLRAINRARTTSGM